MFATDLPIQAVPYTGPPAPRPSQPEPARRVVEGLGEADLESQNRSSLTSARPSLDELKESARQFAEILAMTGSILVASTVSGLRVGQLDVYA